MAPKLKSIDHIHVFVANRQSARTWYENVLDMTPIAELEFWGENGGPLTLSDPYGNIHIALFESCADKCRSTIAFAVVATEFMAWKKHLTEKIGKDLDA